MLSEQKSAPDDLFSIQGFQDALREVMRPNRFSMFYSTEHFWDSCTILLTLAMGIYTFGLFCGTVNYVRIQSGLVDNLKRSTLSRRKRSDMTPQERASLKRKRRLPYRELC